MSVVTTWRLSSAGAQARSQDYVREISHFTSHMSLVVWSMTAEAGGPTAASSHPFWEEACYAFVAGVLEAGLSVAVVLSDCAGSVKVRLMRSLPHSLSTLLLLQFSSFVRVLSL